MNLTRFGIVLITVGLAYSQTLAPRPEFEVASIKPNNSGDQQQAIGLNQSGAFEARNSPVRALVIYAYQLAGVQVVGGPAWIDSDRFDIVAKPHIESGNGQKLQESFEKQLEKARVMLQSLVEDRFQLKVHRETRELPVYVLTVAKGGFKPLKQDCVDFGSEASQAAPKPGQKAPLYCGDTTWGRNGRTRTLDAGGMTMTAFIQCCLGNIADRIILDKTELAGKYNLHLEWVPDNAIALRLQDAPGAHDSGTPPVPVDANAPSVFTALEEQLGLRLQSTKGPVEVMVIDHVERPSPN